MKKKKKEKDLSCNEGDTGSIPGWGTKILHATEQLRLGAATKTRLSQKKNKAK